MTPTGKDVTGMFGLNEKLSAFVHAQPALAAVAAGVAGVAVLLALVWLGRAGARGTRAATRRLGRLRVPAALPYWVVAIGAIAISGVNSYRVAGQALHLPVGMRWAILAIVEMGLVAAGVGLRAASLGRDNTARHRRFLAALFVLVALGALVVLGPVDAVLQIGIVLLGVWAWHLALGLEIAERRERPVSRTALARIAGELRERVLSRLGLADDDRLAAERTADRALTRAARLALRTPRRVTLWRLQRALTAAGALHDPGARARVIEQLRVLRHARDLATLALDTPWQEAAALQAHGSARPAYAPVGQGVRNDAPPARAAHDGAYAAVSDTALDEAEDASTSEDTLGNGELDALVLLTNTPPDWAAMTKTAAVARADQLLPERSARALATALRAVGVDITPESVRGARSRTRQADSPEQEAPVVNGHPRP